MPPSKSEKSENAILELAAEIRAKRQYKEGVRATKSALKKTKLADTFLENNLMLANPAAAAERELSAAAADLYVTSTGEKFVKELGLDKGLPADFYYPSPADMERQKILAESLRRAGYSVGNPTWEKEEIDPNTKFKIHLLSCVLIIFLQHYYNCCY